MVVGSWRKGPGFFQVIWRLASQRTVSSSWPRKGDDGACQVPWDFPLSHDQNDAILHKKQIKTKCYRCACKAVSFAGHQKPEFYQARWLKSSAVAWLFVCLFVYLGTSGRIVLHGKKRSAQGTFLSLQQSRVHRSVVGAVWHQTTQSLALGSVLESSLSGYQHRCSWREGTAGSGRFHHSSVTSHRSLVCCLLSRVTLWLKQSI